jgi:uncharacterized protein YbcI
MTTANLTRGQVERTLAQRIQAFYRELLGHQPSKVTCQLNDRNLLVVLEDSITQAELLLAQTGREELAEQVHSDLDDAMKPQFKELIEETLSVNVVDLLSDATLETGRTGIIVILSEAPDVRIPASIAKNRKRPLQNRNSTEVETQAQ